MQISEFDDITNTLSSNYDNAKYVYLLFYFSILKINFE